MSEINFDFACRDDCLQRMVPSDLRQLVAERDHLRALNAELVEIVRELLDTDKASAWRVLLGDGRYAEIVETLRQ